MVPSENLTEQEDQEVDKGKKMGRNQKKPGSYSVFYTSSHTLLWWPPVTIQVHSPSCPYHVQPFFSSSYLNGSNFKSLYGSTSLTAVLHCDIFCLFEKLIRIPKWNAAPNMMKLRFNFLPPTQIALPRGSCSLFCVGVYLSQQRQWRLLAIDELALFLRCKKTTTTNEGSVHGLLY